MKKSVDEQAECCNEKKPVEHHIYFEWFLNDRAGGPPGYLANLLHGYNQLANYDHPLIIFDTFRGKTPPKENTKKNKLAVTISKVMSLFPGGTDFYINNISKTQKRAFSEMYQFLSNIDKMGPDANLMSRIDFSKTKTIHVHTALDVLKVKNYLVRNYLDDVKVILTCHTPESLAKEEYARAIASGQSERKARILKELYLAAEIKAYKDADIIIFPAEEAMEPLMHDIPEFQKIAANKDIRFMATGSKPICSSLGKEDAKRKYGVSGKKVIGYIGRHNSVKGYDLLKKAAEIILAQRSDVVFLIGGAQGTEFKPLDNTSWIEAGWVNPADLLQALDVFVLPNKQTYYDLVLLEVLSMGVPTVATATGGNKSVKKVAQELELCDVDAQSIADAITELINLPKEELDNKGRKLRETYDNYFTERHMAQRYVDTIRGIYDDYDLWEERIDE